MEIVIIGRKQLIKNKTVTHREHACPIYLPFLIKFTDYVTYTFMYTSL